MRKLFLLFIGGSLILACQHEPIYIHDVIHIDTTGNGGGCGIAVGLYASSITSSSATLLWSPVSGATSYNVQYKVVGNSTWTPSTASTNLLPLSGLTANTSYEFQVQTVCSNGSSAFSGSATFTTINDTTGTGGIPCNPDTVYFQNDILPLIISNCAKPGCHDGSGGEAQPLTTYEQIMSIVKPGNPNQSKLYQVITSGGGEDKMPPYPNTPLTQDQINMIKTWISQGALNNWCGGGTCDTLTTTFSGTVFPIIQVNCVGCHSGSSPGGGIDLTTYSNIYTQATTGNLKGSLNNYPGLPQMPLGGQLSDCDKQQINFWINDGAPNN